MTGPALIAALILATLVAAAAVRARRSAGRARASELGDGAWEPLPYREHSLPTAASDLTLAARGHTRQIVAAFRGTHGPGERLLFQYAFDTGFGDNRRPNTVMLLCREAPWVERPLLATTCDAMAHAAWRPGFELRRAAGACFVGLPDDARRAAAALESWWSTAPVETSIELRAGLLAAYAPGPPARALVEPLARAAESAEAALRAALARPATAA